MLNAVSQQEWGVIREMNLDFWLAPSLRDGRGCNSYKRKRRLRASIGDTVVNFE